jgi:hypothetical protein
MLNTVFDRFVDHALRLQQQQVRVRLRHGQHLIERVELAERALVPSPPELGGHFVRRTCAGRDRRGGLPESDAVVVDEFIDALMNAGSDGTVRGQQHGVFSSTHHLERAEVVAKGIGVEDTLETD